MKAYYYQEDSNLSPQEDHFSNKEEDLVSPEELQKIGVLYYEIEHIEDVDILASQRDYKNRDVVEFKYTAEQDAAKFQEALAKFFVEHLHEDEEIRYILHGSCFFDVRGTNDQWIRCKVSKNDLIILPAGIYHRFTLDLNKDVKAMRLFKEKPKWIALNRPVDSQNLVRAEYVNSISLD